MTLTPSSEMSTPFQVLVVEDDPVIQQLLRSFFPEALYRLSIAGTGQKALDLLEAFPFDLLLCDLRLPDLHGMEVLRRVKKKFQTLPFIVMTADQSPSFAVEALKMGAEDYLLKPFDTKALFHAVETALAKGRLLSENFLLR